MTTASRRKILKLGEDGYDVAEEEVKDKNGSGGRLSLYEASGIGFSIALPICLGALLGVWLDGKFNSHPKFTLSLLFGGIFFAFYQSFSSRKTIFKEEKK